MVRATVQSKKFVQTHLGICYGWSQRVFKIYRGPGFLASPLPQAPPPPPFPPVSCLSFSVFLRVCVAGRANCMAREGVGGGDGAKSYDGEKVWSSISHRCKKVLLAPFLRRVMIVSLALSLIGWSSHRHKSAAWHKFDMVYCSPIPVGRRGIFSFLPAFAALRGEMPNMIVSYKCTSSILNLRYLVCYSVSTCLLWQPLHYCNPVNASLEGKWRLLLSKNESEKHIYSKMAKDLRVHDCTHA